MVLSTISISWNIPRLAQTIPIRKHIMISTTTFILIVVLLNAVVTTVLFTHSQDQKKQIKELNERVGDLEEKTKSIVLED